MFNLGMIPPEDARPFALELMKASPSLALDYYPAGIITLEEAQEAAFRALQQDGRMIAKFVRVGIVTPEDAKPHVLTYLENNPKASPLVFLKVGLVTIEDIKPFLEKNPGLIEPLVKAGLIPIHEVMGMAMANRDAYSFEFQNKLESPYQDPLLKQLHDSGLDVASMIDDDLKFLLDMD